MKFSLIIFLVLVLCPLLMAIIGGYLPRQHRLARAAVFRGKPDDLYAVIRDFAHHHRWRKSVQATQLLPAENGRVRFREVSSHGAITFVVLEDVPGERLVTEVADEHLPFTGRWTLVFAALPDGTRVTITEEGVVKNPVFRFMARFIFGYATTMEAYLRDLARKFGEEPRVFEIPVEGATER
jgi:hypothetical protein